jgi:hypothetical protein
MSTEKMRKEFEVAFTEEMVARCGEGYRSSVEFFFVEKEPDGEYSNPIAHAGWFGWRASRAPLLVDLPKPLPSGDYRMTVPFYKAADIIKALSAAGFEVKP